MGLTAELRTKLGPVVSKKNTQFPSVSSVSPGLSLSSGKWKVGEQAVLTALTGFTSPKGYPKSELTQPRKMSSIQSEKA